MASVEAPEERGVQLTPGSPIRLEKITLNSIVGQLLPAVLTDDLQSLDGISCHHRLIMKEVNTEEDILDASHDTMRFPEFHPMRKKMCCFAFKC